MAIQSSFPDIKPSLNLDFANTKQLDPRITFTRASTATYYDGKTVAKAEENLLLNSATLATQNVTVTAQAYTLSFENTGTVTLSGASTAGPLVGTGVSNRVSLTFTPTAGTLTLTVSGTVSNAQLEARSSATAYTPTTTQPITNYIPVLQTAAAGIPRFDHNPVTGESLGFLIEEQRTNLLTYSEQFDNAVWLKTGASVTANKVVAPDGTLTADLLVEDATTGEHRVRVSGGAKSANAVMTFSVYARPSGRYMVLALEYSGQGLYTTFDVLTNQYWDFSADTGWTRGQTVITSVGNGWYRCSISGTTSADLSVTARVHLASLAGFNKNASYTGDGTSGIYIWGAQLEAGAFATSYIPTAASQVTRSADAASMAGTNFSSWFRQDEGTVYVQGLGKTRFLAMQIGAVRFMDIAWTSTTAVGSYSNNTPSGYLTIKTGIDQNSPVSVALSYASQDWASAYNGTAGGTGGQLTDINPDNLRIGNYQNTGYLNGTIRRLAYYPKRLSNTQLQALTL